MVVFALVYGLAFWVLISLYMVTFIPYFLLRWFSTEQEYRYYLGWISRMIGRLLLATTGTRIHIEGKENIPVGKPYCFIGNHQAYADILVMMATTPEPVGFIAKASLKKVPIIRTWMLVLGCYFLRRNSLKDGMKAILYGADRVKRRRPMVIFPEGTRSKGPDMLPFRKGGVKLATKARALAIPVSIHGSYRILERRGWPCPTWIGVKFHPPVDTSTLKGPEEDALADRIRDTIQAGVRSLQSIDPSR